MHQGHQFSELCSTVNVYPAICNVPVRSAWLPGFFDTLNATEPLPVPLPPEVIVIHDALLLAVHAQPLPADTLTVPVPALSDMATLVGLIA